MIVSIGACRAPCKLRLDGERPAAAEPAAQACLERDGVDRPDPGTVSAARIFVPDHRDDPNPPIERVHVTAAVERVLGEPLAIGCRFDQQRRPGAHSTIARYVGGE